MYHIRVCKREREKQEGWRVRVQPQVGTDCQVYYIGFAGANENISKMVG